MKHIVLFSNGAASAWCAWWVLQNCSKEDVILLYHNPGAEHPDGMRFQKDVSKFLKHPVVNYNYKKTLWELIEEQHCLPSFHIPYCARILKMEMGEKYYKTIKDKITVYIGFGADEPGRIQKSFIRQAINGRKAVFPLNEIEKDGEWAKEVIRNEWGICLPEPYLNLKHNNCIPCFKGGKGQFLSVAKYYPEQYEKASQMEELVGHTVFKDCNLRELKNRGASVIGQQELFDTRPCLCAN